MTNAAEVYLWNTRVGIIRLDDTDGYVTYEYDRNFLNSGIELAPICMPLSSRIYKFTDLPYSTFHGVPGLLADSLPDKFGNAIINHWLAAQGREPDSFNAIERLCYTGKRGMGALEYVPAIDAFSAKSEPVDINNLVMLASDVLSNRQNIKLSSNEDMSQRQLLQLGTSAGGARAKAIIAWNETSGDIRSGQVDAGTGYGYWLIKFDGVEQNGDHGNVDKPMYTRVEYAYHLMARAAGINMNECRLLHENGRFHFMTKRFDRNPDTGAKIHMQTLAALAHIDYNVPCLCSYEQAAMYGRMIGLNDTQTEEMFRRMVFNVAAVNQDDHVKNMSFLMDKSGKWSLAPAYDLTYSYKAGNRWLAAHQMTVNGKNQHIGLSDLLKAGQSMELSSSKCQKIINEVTESIQHWSEYAELAGLDEDKAAAISQSMLKNGIAVTS